MPVTCSVVSRINTKADAIVVFLLEDEKEFKSVLKGLTKDIPHLQPLFDTGDMTGSKGSVVTGYVGSAASSPRIVIAGLGKREGMTAEVIRRSAAAATKKAAALGCKHVAYEVPEIKGFTVGDIAAAITEGSVLCQYAYDKFKAKKDSDMFVKKFTLLTDNSSLKDVREASKMASGTVEGVIEARDLANAPNNVIYPQTLGARCRVLGKKHGFKTTVFDKKKITELKMGGLLGVNQGSVRPPVFIIMEYYGGPKSQKPIVLVGKGITFDTGGISIKPAAGMAEMKGDMGGSATVIGTMVALANTKAKRNVIALVPSTENMPSGSAYVPGDILTFMNGKTAEIDNTDAEGRLVLADALCYAARYKPETVIDVATLTGACVIALGSVTTGMMGTDEKSMDKLRVSGVKTHERVCELPLYEEYEEQIMSDVADIKNSGGRAAGTITAGLFLKNFVSYPWIHLDIAGTGMVNKPTAYTPRGNTGVGVRLLTDAIHNW